MRNYFHLFIFILFLSPVFGQTTTRIEGVTTGFVGRKIEFYLIQDYFSYKDSLIGEAIIQKDSSFQVDLSLKRTEKILIKCHKNSGFIYANPGSTYKISLPDKDPYNAYRPQGNKVEIAFLELPKTDINFKILEFDNWVNDFLGVYYNRKTTSSLAFSQQLDTFKLNVDSYYKADTSFFLKTYIRYTIASLDDINFVGAKSRIDKYLFYLSEFPLAYSNERYTAYLSLFYKNIFAVVSTDINTKIYKSILSSSPTQLMKCLGRDATLRNPQIRELVAIQGISEVYNGKDYPRTNMVTILDSIARFGLYKSNRFIAKRIIERLTELAPGMKAPSFEIVVNSKDTVRLSSYADKYVYFQFIDPMLQESKKQVELLKPLYVKYGNTIRFVTIIDVHNELDKEQKAYYSSIPWEKHFLAYNDPIFKSYMVKSFPSYVLIDEVGVLHSYPAAGPIPDGEYETVEKVFYTIKRKIEVDRLNKEKSGFDDIYDDTK